MAYRSVNYKPHKKNREILERAWEHVNNVPYKVTLRWLFYRLLQDGYYGKKTDYNGKFMALFSAARHNFYGSWKPDTLIDDRRTSVERGDGFNTSEDWLDRIPEALACNLHMWKGQEYYVELWFEAGAMRSQFEHYTWNITLRPFYGDASIPYKYEIAKALEYADAIYAKAIKVIYFGDLDPKGETIPKSALTDIRLWCDVEFDFIRAGLNIGDEVKYNIPENPDKTGTYQWEAVEDNAAREIIESAVAQYVDYGQMEKRKREQLKTTAWVRGHLTGLRDEYENRSDV